MNTMPLEADTRVLIDTNLRNLGWNFTGKNRNVFFERPKTDTEKKKLGGKRPDYVLYSKDGEPLIVIEAKKRGEKIDAALEQGIYYAKTLEAPLVFATDGIFCKSFHTKANRTPILNGEEIDEFIREALALRYLSTWEVNTVSPKVQYDRKELIKIFDEANNMLRGDGLRAGIERFGEFANILFLKLISESEQIKRESGIKTAFDTACSWDSIKNIPISTRIDYINKTVYEKLNKLYNTEIFTLLRIRDASSLKEIMDKLDPLMLTDVDSDVKGDAFEYFLKESTSTKNDLGEYFTPRHIVKTMVRLVNPQIGEKVYDPFCGTGGFLIETFRHIERNMVSGNPKLQKILKEETIYGNEITNTARITKMNMILAGDGHSNIHMRDSLANPVYIDEIVRNDKGEICRDSDNNIELSDDNYNAYDVVITNMPYSQKTKFGSLYDIPSTNGDSICVQHCMKAISSLSENGRMALVVPEGFLFRKDLAKMREYMLERCELQSIISLPQGVFLPYTGVKTNIIYATKVNKKIKTSNKRKNFWYFDVKSDGYSLDNHRRKLDMPSDLSKYEEFRKLDNEQTEDMMKVGFELIPLDKVRENSYVLVGSRYRETTPITDSKFDIIRLTDICNFIRGISFPKAAQKTNFSQDYLGVVTTKAAQSEGIDKQHIIYVEKDYVREDKMLKKGDILISLANSLNLIGRVTYVEHDYECLSFGAFMGLIRADRTKINPVYLFYILKSVNAKSYFTAKAKTTTNISNLTFEDLSDFELPLPSLDEQAQIVNELENYQCIIDSARAIIGSYKPVPKIPKNCDYVKINYICKETYGGGTPSTFNKDFWGGHIPWITSADIDNENNIVKRKYITKLGVENSRSKIIPSGNVIVASRVGLGKIAINEFDVAINQDLQGLILDTEKVLPKYFVSAFSLLVSEIIDKSRGTTIKGITKGELLNLNMPLPSIVDQEQIIAQIEAEQALVEPSKQLIKVFEKKIHEKIAEVWGDE